MPLTKVQKLLFLADSPYLKLIKSRLGGENAAMFLEHTTTQTPSQQKKSSGFATYRHLRSIPQQFYEYANMRVDTFDLLLTKIKPTLTERSTKFGPSPIPVEHQLILTLRFLITGSSSRVLGKHFKLGSTTISNIIYEVCSAITDHLYEEYLPSPTEDRWDAIVDHFYRTSGFPNCLGILEGVNMTIRHQNEFLYLYMIAVIDHEGRLVVSNVQCTPQEKNAALRAFPLDDAMDLWEENLPISKRLPKSNIEAPCVLLADEQFPQTARILKPAVSPVAKEAKLLVTKIEGTKKKPESVFKKMMSRWRALKRTVTCHSTGTALFHAVCVVHNFILASEGSAALDSEVEPYANWQSVRSRVFDNQGLTSTIDALRVRQVFQQFFQHQEKVASE